MYGQKSLQDIRSYMKENVPVEWSLDNRYDSMLVFKKLVHWQYVLDPPPDSYGEDDTMCMYVFIHPLQTDSDRIRHENILKKISEKKEELKTHRSDSIYRDKRGFYDWMYKYNQLQQQQELNEFTHFSYCSITFGYYNLRSPFMDYDEMIDKEADQIKETLINYLK